jgi:hypothetical protein
LEHTKNTAECKNKKRGSSKREEHSEEEQAITEQAKRDERAQTKGREERQEQQRKRERESMDNKRKRNGILALALALRSFVVEDGLVGVQGWQGRARRGQRRRGAMVQRRAAA